MRRFSLSGFLLFFVFCLVLPQTLANAESLRQGLRNTSLTAGRLAESYEAQGRLQEALSLSRQASFVAQEFSENRLLGRWYWLTGRLLKGLGESEGALVAYRMAVAEAQASLGGAGGDCQDDSNLQPRPITSLYDETIDLLLRRARQPDRSFNQRSADLAEARQTLEHLKVRELRDYFQDDCLASLRAKQVDIDVLAPHSAILYPVILPDRVEMLTSVAGRMRSYLIPLPGAQLTETINQFRLLLETRTSAEYLPLAQALYDLLIRPMAADLEDAQVDTLVIVPTGAFLLMPFAALHDGQQFLIATYATAITPGLDMTDPHPLPREGLLALAVGMSQARPGFPALPAVVDELGDFHRQFGGEVLIDEQFEVAAVEKILRQRPINLIHIASHGSFAPQPADTFLLAHDQKMTMDRLSELIGLAQFRDQPLELLTLSACQTAAGDERAALGLAGVAVKSGARSALATLWSINDRASSLLIAAFYAELKRQGQSKAQALRRAKLMLMADSRYRHPAYWAPFLLINNWL